MASVLYSNSGKKLITTNSLWFLDIDHHSLSDQQYNLGFSVASFILFSLIPTFFQVELLSGVELWGFSLPAWEGPPLSMLRTGWVSVWDYSQGAPVLPARLWGQQPLSALLTSTASILKGNGWRTAPWNTNLECYKKKKIPKYSRRLRRIEVLNCCLSTSHILIINLCVDTWFFSDIWIRYAAFFCVSEYI